MEIVNVEQAAAWDGHEGNQWAEDAERYERAGRRQWQRFLDANLVTSDDDVVDIGCGTGRSSRDVARIALDGRVLGVDLSARMLERARQSSKAEGLTNVSFEQGDAQVYPFDAAVFDVAMSCFGAMFFNDATAAFRNFGASLRPGGRLAVLAWRSLTENEWLNVFRSALAAGRELGIPPVGAPSPFGLADPDHVRTVLTAAGFSDVELAKVDEPIEFGKDADDAWSFIRTIGIVEGLTQDLDEPTKASALDALHGAVADHETPDGVLFGTAAWLITARRA